MRRALQWLLCVLAARAAGTWDRLEDTKLRRHGLGAARPLSGGGRGPGLQAGRRSATTDRFESIFHPPPKSRPFGSPPRRSGTRLAADHAAARHLVIGCSLMDLSPAAGKDEGHAAPRAPAAGRALHKTVLGRGRMARLKTAYVMRARGWVGEARSRMRWNAGRRVFNRHRRPRRLRRPERTGARPGR